MGLFWREWRMGAKIRLLLLMLLVTACNTLKKVGDDELLLTKNTIYADGEKVSGEDLKGLLAQKPNSHVLGYPLRLNLYNMAKEDSDSLFLDWLHRKEKREERLNRMLSKKQVNRLRESFVVKGANDFLKRIGEPPAVIDTTLAQKSIDRLKAYYNTKGYFNSKGQYVIVPSKRKKRAELNYNLDLGQPYSIDSVATDITSSQLDSMYQKYRAETFVKQGEIIDLEDYTTERETLTSLFRNNGVYNFQESSINYTIEQDTVRASEDKGLNVQLNIDKPVTTTETDTLTNEYYVHRFKKINIYSDYDISGTNHSLQSIEFDNYIIYYYNELKYRPKALADAVFFEKDSVYRDLDRIRTYRQFTNLNTFKYPNIDFVADTTGHTLTTNIYLAPRPKFSLNLNFDVTHSNFQRLGTALSASVITRNVFGGAETLNLSARGSIGLLSDSPITDETFTSEIGGDINITFPRIWFPLDTKSIIPYYMLPQSRFLVGTNFQRNIGLDKQTFNSILSYNWSPTLLVKHNIELLNVEFVRNVNTENFFNVYGNTYARLDAIADSFEDNPDFATFYDETEFPSLDADTELDLLIPSGTNGFIDAVLADGFNTDEETLNQVRSIEERQERLTENNLIFASSYTFTKTNKTDISDNNFYQLRLKLESAGNILSLMSGIVPYNENPDGQLLVFSVPFSQYIKPEIDFIKHWPVGGSKVLAFRSFVGMAIPYGNSTNIPFVRSYFAGGSNDNRAWNAYELGPGSTSNVNDFNEANLKMAFNFEYRFPIAGDVKGALFADAGNIWYVFDDEDNPDAIFSGFESLQDLALGTGMGLRYDFSYFVFRLDLGFKTYNPAEEASKRWFRDYNFRNAVFNVGINYPF